MADNHEQSHLAAYFGVFFALMLLTGATVAASFMDLGAAGGPVAVAIACVKATLVILYFMHIKYETKLVALYAASGFVFLLILFVMTMGEVAGRGPAEPDHLGPPPPAVTAPAAAAVAPEHGDH